MPGANPQNKGTEPSKPFNFLGLPPELRNEIYRRVLAPDESHIVLIAKCLRTGKFVSKPKRKNWTSLLATNRQIHKEADGILFDSNIFCFSLELTYAKDFKAFFAQIRRRNARNISRVMICRHGAVTLDRQRAGNDELLIPSKCITYILREISRHCTRLRMFVVMIRFIYDFTARLHEAEPVQEITPTIPSLDRLILTPFPVNLVQVNISPRLKDRLCGLGWEVYGSYNEYVEAYQDLFLPGQPDPRMLEFGLMGPPEIYDEEETHYAPQRARRLRINGFDV